MLAISTIWRAQEAMQSMLHKDINLTPQSPKMYAQNCSFAHPCTVEHTPDPYQQGIAGCKDTPQRAGHCRFGSVHEQQQRTQNHTCCHFYSKSPYAWWVWFQIGGGGWVWVQVQRLKLFGWTMVLQRRMMRFRGNVVSTRTLGPNLLFVSALPNLAQLAVRTCKLFEVQTHNSGFA